MNAHDLTVVREVEALKEAADERLRLALRAARLGAWQWQMSDGVVVWDERLEAIFGLPPGRYDGTFETWAAMLHPEDAPDMLAIVDEAVATLSPYVLRTRIVHPDGSVHAIEAFTSASANNNPVSRTLAKEALRLLGANIEIAVKNGAEMVARQAMLLGAMLAGQAFANSPVAAVHALAYPIGGLYHVPHGLSNSLVLPHVLRFNATVCGDAYAELAPCLFPQLESADRSGRLAGFLEGLASLPGRLNLPVRLRDVGIPKDGLALLAESAMEQTRLLVNNPRTVLLSDAARIYEDAW